MALSLPAVLAEQRELDKSVLRWEAAHMHIKSLVKVAAAATAVLCLTASVYKGDRVTINFPDGWEEPEADDDGLVTSRQGENGANCNVESKNVAGIANMTMAEINAEYGHVFTVGEWADFLGMPTSDITLLNSDIRPLEDAFLHIATMKVKASDTVTAMTRYGFYVLPGRVVMAGCYIEESLYPIYTTTFENVISSLRPW
jgi:hypothetical protein